MQDSRAGQVLAPLAPDRRWGGGVQQGQLRLPSFWVYRFFGAACLRVLELKSTCSSQMRHAVSSDKAGSLRNAGSTGSVQFLRHLRTANELRHGHAAQPTLIRTPESQWVVWGAPVVLDLFCRLPVGHDLSGTRQPAKMAEDRPKSVKDVPAEAFIKAFAAHLKQGNKVSGWRRQGGGA